MAPVNRSLGWQNKRTLLGVTLALALGLGVQAFAVPALQAQSADSQSQPPATSQSNQDIPDAPSTVQPPPPKPVAPPQQEPDTTVPPAQTTGNDSQLPAQQQTQPPPPMPPIKTLPPGSVPANQISPTEDLYKLVVKVNFVQLPVMVKDSDGRRVDGLLPRDFTVLENGKPQKLTYFTSDPFELSVAVVLDIGLPDVALQKVNQTFSALVSAFSPYDEVALYTYSSTVSQQTDFSARPQKLEAVLNEMKLVRGRNGVPVLNGPFAGGPTVNGAPVGGGNIAPVNTPPRENYVLNDAILEAALDLSKRDRTRRKLILVISDGRELGSRASYRDVLKVLETHGIQLKAVVVDTGALPGYRQIEKIHLKFQGYNDILPKYSNATGGGAVLAELSRNAIEDAYSELTSEARNQYTLGYIPQATAGSSARREIDVLVDRPKLKVYTKDAYYPVPAGR